MTRTVPKAVFREPLLHFLLIGAALFALSAWRGGPSASGGPAGAPAARITVTADDVAQLENQFARAWQRPPTVEERQGLIDDFVRNEIWCREAIALGLDRDDAVLRRRLRQKMEFIYEDISALAEPTDAELQAFLERHRVKYLAGPQVAFSQVCVGKGGHGPDAEAAARRALARLRGGVDPDAVGDATMLPPGLPLTPLADINAQFGEAFGRNLLALPPGVWAGPVRSAYGLHLVRVAERRDESLPAWDDLRGKVRQDWTAAKQQELKDAAYARLRERYAVTIESPAATGPAAPAVADAKGPVR